MLWLTIDAGAPPWIALGLAVSFGIYGLLRKVVAVDPVAGLGVESVYLFVPASLLAAWGEQGHGGAFLSGWNLCTDAMLIFGGVVTALPLIGFAYGVRPHSAVVGGHPAIHRAKPAVAAGRVVLPRAVRPGARDWLRRDLGGLAVVRRRQRDAFAAVGRDALSQRSAARNTCGFHRREWCASARRDCRAQLCGTTRGLATASVEAGSVCGAGQWPGVLLHLRQPLIDRPAEQIQP